MLGGDDRSEDDDDEDTMDVNGMTREAVENGEIKELEEKGKRVTGPVGTEGSTA